MNFELGFGVCLYKTKTVLGLLAKLLIERLEPVFAGLIFPYLPDREKNPFAFFI